MNWTTLAANQQLPGLGQHKGNCSESLLGDLGSCPAMKMPSGSLQVPSLPSTPHLAQSLTHAAHSGDYPAQLVITPHGVRRAESWGALGGAVSTVAPQGNEGQE